MDYTMDETEESNVNYSSKLLDIELGQNMSRNYKQLNLFDETGKINNKIASRVNDAIDNALKLHKKDKEKYYIYFPIEIERRLPKELRKKITKEITANEVRVLTAIVILAHFANLRGEFFYLEKINKAYFEVDISNIYRVMGIDSNEKGRYRTLAKNALFDLNSKKYVIDSNDEIIVTNLVEIHTIDKKNNNKLKVIVEGSLFDFNKGKRSTYFHVPSDINKKIRKVTTGRPNAQIELFIKCLYQAKHCTNTNTVEYTYDRLFDIMKLQKLLENRNNHRIKPTIQRAFETAKKIGLVKSVREERAKFGSTKYVIEFA